MFSSVLGANSAAMTRSAASGEPDRQETSCDEGARNDLRGAPHRRGVGDGIPVTRGAHGPHDPERQNGEERAATRCPFCAPRPRGVNRDRTQRVASPRLVIGRAMLDRPATSLPKESHARRRLTRRREGVYARCTSGSARRSAAGEVRSRAVAISMSRQPRRTWHEFAAAIDPERVRRIDGPRHRRDPERRPPRRGRRHRGGRPRPRRIRRGEDRRDGDDRHAGLRGHAPAHVADAGARRPPVLHARQLLRRRARQRRRSLPPRGRAHRQLRRLARGDQRRRDHAARLVPHQQHARPLGRRRPRAEGRGHPGDLRARRARRAASGGRSAS